MSLDGLLVLTAEPFALGSLLPLSVLLADSKEAIHPIAEVVRRTEAGFGAKFVQISDADRRRLRRFIGDLNATRNRRQAAELATGGRSTTLTSANADETLRILQRASSGGAKSEALTLIPEQSSARFTGNLGAVVADHLEVRIVGNCRLEAGDKVLVICSSDYTSYSFSTHVIKKKGKLALFAQPTSIHYVDRRIDRRSSAALGSMIKFSPNEPGGREDGWPIFDRGIDGFSFLVPIDKGGFSSGTHFSTVHITNAGGTTEEINDVVIRHITPYAGKDGPMLMVGASFGVARQYAFIENTPLGGASASFSIANVYKWVHDVSQRLSYLIYKMSRPKKRAKKGGLLAPTLVHFPNRTGKEVAALLSCTKGSQKKAHCPLIIITPGFAGRKETFSYLATTLLYNFLQHQCELSVLRLDGTNNLGQSYKDPGAEQEGKHTMRFTLSGGIDDIVGAVQWAKANPYISPSGIVLLSSSFSSISARRAMTLPELSQVKLWIALMGPPDGAHPIANAMGNSDPYRNFLQGIPNGLLTMFGCLADGDNVCRDMHEHKLATLEDARRDMAQIGAEVVWVVGKHDAFIDPDRVKDVMTVKAAGKRRIFEVPSGHLPRSSDQAVAQFRMISEIVWQHIHGSQLTAISPPAGMLARIAEGEWAQVRRTHSPQNREYWADYLLGDEGIGYDIWSLTSEYQELMTTQARLLQARGRKVLDLGSGTGNAAFAVAADGPLSLTVYDLVASALDRAEAKVSSLGVPVHKVIGSADGSLRIAVRRWLNGELGDIGHLLTRFPSPFQEAAAAIREKGGRDLNDLLRGGDGSVAQTLAAAGLPGDFEALVEDVRILARWEQGTLDEKTARASLSANISEEALAESGLPFSDGAFDCVVASLLVSYLREAEDMISEVFRVMSTGGTFVMSTLLPDTEGSQNYLNAVKTIEATPEDALPAGQSRQSLLDAAHRFLDRACDLVRFEEEGIFHFSDGNQLQRLVEQAGFINSQCHMSFGSPPQAVIVVCRKP